MERSESIIMTTSQKTGEKADQMSRTSSKRLNRFEHIQMQQDLQQTAADKKEERRAQLENLLEKLNGRMSKSQKQKKGRRTKRTASSDLVLAVVPQ